MAEYDAAVLERYHGNEAHSCRTLPLIVAASEAARAMGRQPEPCAFEPAPEVLAARRKVLVKKARANGMTGSVHQFTPMPERPNALRASLRKVRQWCLANETLEQEELKKEASAPPPRSFAGPPGAIMSVDEKASAVPPAPTAPSHRHNDIKVLSSLSALPAFGTAAPTTLAGAATAPKTVGATTTNGSSSAAALVATSCPSPKYIDFSVHGVDDDESERGRVKAFVLVSNNSVGNAEDAP
jgi:hypothetical protein